jgi:hypothetical protein
VSEGSVSLLWNALKLEKLWLFVAKKEKIFVFFEEGGGGGCPGGPFLVATGTGTRH